MFILKRKSDGWAAAWGYFFFPLAEVALCELAVYAVSKKKDKVPVLDKVLLVEKWHSLLETSDLSCLFFLWSF